MTIPTKDDGTGAVARERAIDWPSAPTRVPLPYEREIWLQAAAWSHLRAAIGHLQLVGRVMWPNCPDCWVDDKLRRWLDALDSAVADDLADALEEEAVAVARRSTP